MSIEHRNISWFHICIHESLDGLLSTKSHFTKFIHQLQTTEWDYHIDSHHSIGIYTKNGKPKTLKNIGWLVWEGMLLLELENTLGTKQKFMQRSWKSNAKNMIVPNKCIIRASKTLPTPNLHADLRKFWHQKAERSQHYLIRGVRCSLVKWNGSKGMQRKKPIFQMSFTQTKKHRLFCFFPVYPEKTRAAKSWNLVYWVPSHTRIEFHAFGPIEEPRQTYLCLMGAK